MGFAATGLAAAGSEAPGFGATGASLATGASFTAGLSLAAIVCCAAGSFLPAGGISAISGWFEAGRFAVIRRHAARVSLAAALIALGRSALAAQHWPFSTWPLSTWPLCRSGRACRRCGNRIGSGCARLVVVQDWRRLVGRRRRDHAWLIFRSGRRRGRCGGCRWLRFDRVQFLVVENRFRRWLLGGRRLGRDRLGHVRLGYRLGHVRLGAAAS